MPVILGPDGPSLGGFVCPVTIAMAELWKIGQLQAGRPHPLPRAGRGRCARAVGCAAARDRDAVAGAARRLSRPRAAREAAARRTHEAVLIRVPAATNHPEICIRQSGDDNLLVEFGAAVLDIELRCYVQATYEALRARRLPALLDLTPGIRSLQLHFDCDRASQAAMIEEVQRALATLPSLDALELPSRIVHLPLSWDDPATQLAIERYTSSVRADAPWCPSNIEFIRRINGLESIGGRTPHRVRRELPR